MAKNDLRINVLGVDFTISTDEDPEYLARLLDKYRQTVDNVQKLSGLKDPLKIAVLTGFLISDDIEKAGTSSHGGHHGNSEVEQLTRSMIVRLEEAVSGQKGLKPEQPSFYRLLNTVKNYEWGSPEWIPSLLGQENPDRKPWAELWIGVNSEGPSRVIFGIAEDSVNGEEAPPVLLGDLIDKDPLTFLGERAFRIFGRLPFLFKVEAAEKPLSIQAHPNKEQAREGYERENRDLIPLDAPYRNYRDANHKPELLCALGSFAALCGFRKPGEISTLLEILSSEDIFNGIMGGLNNRNSQEALKAGFASLIAALSRENPLKSFLEELYKMSGETLDALGSYIRSRFSRLKREHPQYQNEWEYCNYLSGLAESFSRPDSEKVSGDPGIIAPLFLNIVELEKGEAIYLPAGVFHAYIHGIGIEVMADSNNVLRGGLTGKYTDPQELCRILNFTDYRPVIMKAPDPAPIWYSYPAQSDDFALSLMNGSSSPSPYAAEGPSIVLFVRGTATMIENETGAETVFSQGESIFIPAGRQSNLLFYGDFTAYAASIPSGSI